MPAIPLTPEPQEILDFDVQGGASVSESILAKYGATNNYVLSNFERYYFGVTGAFFSGLTTPYIFSNNIDNIRTKCELTNIYIYIGTTGISGDTYFRIERQLAAGGAWTTIFSTDAKIGSGVTDGYAYNMVDGGAGDIINPSFAITDFEANDKLRFVLQSSALQAANLNLLVLLKPVN